MRAESWRNLAGFGTWLVVGLPEIARMASGRLEGPPAVLWVVAFGAALTSCLLFDVPRRLVATLLVVQTIAGLTMIAVSRDGTTSATLVIVAAEAASIFSLPVAWSWAAVQSIAIAAIIGRSQGV